MGTQKVTIISTATHVAVSVNRAFKRAKGLGRPLKGPGLI